MRRLFLLLLLPFLLHAVEDDFTKYNYVANFEGIPSAVVNGCVNVITGDLCIYERDMTVAGPEPLTLERSFISSDCTFGSLCHNWNSNHYGRAEAKITQPASNRIHQKIDMEEGLGRKGEYLSGRGLPTQYKHYHLKLNPLLYNYGLTNAGSEEISGRTNLKNYAIYADGVFCTLIQGNGERRVFQRDYKEKKKRIYKLFKTLKPANLKHYYRYFPSGKLDGVFLMSHGNQVFSSIKFLPVGRHPGYQDVIGSDGQKVRYHFTREDHGGKKKCYFVKKVERSCGPTVEYAYEARKNRHDGERRRLILMKRPENRFLQIQYYNPKKNDVAGQNVDLHKKRDPRTHRVALLKGPVGADASPYVMYKFFYTVNADNTSGTTNVYNAGGKLTQYRYSRGRLDCINRHMNGGVYSCEKLYWGNRIQDRGNLLTHSWESAGGKVEACRHFVYDANGNILKEMLFGNITGGNAAPVIINGGDPKNCGAERYEKRFAYTPGNLLLTETDLLKTVEYRYHPVTDKMTAKFTLSEEKIVKREFFEYNGYGVLIKEVQDDGSTRDETNLTDVTERYVTITNLTGSPPFFMPAEICRFALDPETGSLKLLGRTVNGHSKRGFLTFQKTFDAEGRQVAARKWEYNDRGNIISETDPKGNVTIRKYDANDNLVFEQGPNPGLQKRFRYDCMNRLIQKQLILEEGTGISTFYRYDLCGNKTAEIDIYGNETRFQYDALNRLIKTTQKGREERFAYNSLGHMTEKIDAFGHRTKRSCNLHGDPCFEKHPDGSSETWRYNLDGSLLDHTDKTGLRVRYRYDWAGRPLEKRFFSETGELLYSTTASYSAFHKLSETDASGVETRYEYDFAGRLARKTKGNSETLYAYDTLGRECKTIFVDNEASYTTFKEHDDLGQLLEERVEDGKGNVQSSTRYEYDPYGNRTAVITGDSVTSTEYNAQNMPLSITDAEGNTTRIVYRYDYRNAAGRKVACEERTSPNGTVTRTEKDAFGNIALVVKKNSLGMPLQKQRFEYDACNNPVRRIDTVIVDGKEEWESVTEWEYDPAGRVTKITEATGTPEQKTVRIAYNRRGQKERYTKADGISIDYTYDAFGRLSKERSSDGTIDYRYEYDLLGNPLRILDNISGKTTERSYDCEGRMTFEKLANGLTLEFYYDRLGRGVKTALPDRSGYKAQYKGKKLSAITRTDSSGKELYSHRYLEYDAASGRLLEAQLPQAAGLLSLRYDRLGRILNITSGHWRETIEGYDEAGNLPEKTVENAEGLFSYRYSYDALDQLASESGPTTHQYLCDSLYNRLRKEGEEVGISPLHRPVRTKEAEYRYDDNGNRIEKQERGVTAVYRYDAFNRLISLEKEGERIEYVYDVFNRRISRTVNGATELFLYRNKEEIGLVAPDGTVQQLKVLGRGAAIAIELNGRAYAPVHDQSGNIALLVDIETGTPFENYRSSAFGEEEGGAYQNPWRFSGKRHDPESGLVYFGQRYYDPALGTWLTPDPAGFADSINLYQFCFNNPLRFHDPDGRFVFLIPLFSGLAFEAVVQAALYSALTCIAIETAVYTADYLSYRYNKRYYDNGLPYNWDDLNLVSYCVRSSRRNLPLRGKPNSSDSIDRGNGKGQIRDYDQDGRAKTDYDFGHDHNESGDPHAHDWDWSNNSGSPPRSSGRPIRPGE